MMNSIQMSEVLKTLNNWGFVDSFSVGGFEYMGFSEKTIGDLKCILKQKEQLSDPFSEKMRDHMLKWLKTGALPR